MTADTDSSHNTAPDNNLNSVSLRRRWLQAAGGGVVLQGIGLLLSFASSVFLARLLGAYGLGQYSLVLAIVAVLSVVACMGLPAVIARILATTNDSNDWPHARGLLRYSNMVALVAGLTLGSALVAIGYLWHGASQVLLYATGAPLIAILAWANIRQRALQGLNHPIAAQLPEQLVKHSVFLMLGLLIWFAGYKSITSPTGAMSVWLFAALANLAIGGALLHRMQPIMLRDAKPEYLTAEWRTIATPVFTTDILTVVFANSDTIILGMLTTPEDVGLYQVSLRLSLLLLVFLAASNWVLTPWFARFHANDESPRFQDVVTRTTRAIFLVTFILYLLAILLGKEFIHLFFGEEFTRSFILLAILGAGQLVNVACGPVVNILLMTGGQKALAQCTTLVAALNIVACIVLVHLYGILGASISVALATATYNILLAVVVRQRSGIDPTLLGLGYAPVKK